MTTTTMTNMTLLMNIWQTHVPVSDTCSIGNKMFSVQQFYLQLNVDSRDGSANISTGPGAGLEFSA